MQVCTNHLSQQRWYVCISLTFLRVRIGLCAQVITWKHKHTRQTRFRQGLLRGSIYVKVPLICTGISDLGSKIANVPILIINATMRKLPMCKFFITFNMIYHSDPAEFQFNSVLLTKCVTLVVVLICKRTLNFVTFVGPIFIQFSIVRSIILTCVQIAFKENVNKTKTKFKLAQYYLFTNFIYSKEITATVLSNRANEINNGQ